MTEGSNLASSRPRMELTQFTHVIDVGPTILDIAGLPQPTEVNAIAQRPMHGTSFQASLTDAGAPEHRTHQYFEMYGNRGIDKDGWWATSMLPRTPWVVTPEIMKNFAPGVFDPATLEWELYYLPDDFAQARNLAAEQPGKIQELNDLWWVEAEKYGALPLLGGLSAFFGVVPPLSAKTRWTFWGADVRNLSQGAMAPIHNALFVQDGRLRNTYSFMGALIVQQVADAPLPTGNVQVAMDFTVDAAVMAPGGAVTSSANGQVIGKGRMDHTVPILFSAYSGLDIGRDNGEVVDRAYEDKAPFTFTGTIEKVTFDIRPPADPAAHTALHQAQHPGQQARHTES